MKTDNKIDGEEIFHQRFGRGIITDYNGSQITVHFDADEADFTRSFQFPDIFYDSRKLLITNSQEILGFVELDKNKHLCIRCEKRSNNITPISGKNLCSNCIEQMITCKDCGGLYEQNECKLDYYGRLHCNTCHIVTHFNCSVCGNEYSNEEMMKSPFIDKKTPLCESCAEETMLHCAGCYNFIPEEIALNTEHSHYCPTCFEKETFLCNECGIRSTKRSTEIQGICYNCESKILYLNHISSMDIFALPSHTIPFYTFRNARTVGIVSRLRHSYGEQNPFDVLFLESLFGTLVVVWAIPKRFKDLSKYGCTLTALKKDGFYRLIVGNTCEISKDVVLPDNKIYHIWKLPYELRAQTFSDMGYGDRYHWKGNDLVEIDEGNKYGDTSSFCIIGYIE